MSNGTATGRMISVELSGLAIERPATKVSLARDLVKYITGIRGEARDAGMDIRSGLGMAAIQLLTRGELWGLKHRYPALTDKRIQAKINGLSKAGLEGFSDFTHFDLGGADVFTVCNELDWIGISVIDEEGRLERERQVIARTLSDISQQDIILEPNEEMFLNVGIIHQYSEDGIDSVLDFVDSKMPSRVDVYNVGASMGTFHLTITT